MAMCNITLVMLKNNIESFNSSDGEQSKLLRMNFEM